MVSLSPQTGSKETCQIKQKDVCELRQFVCEGISDSQEFDFLV